MHVPFLPNSPVVVLHQFIDKPLPQCKPAAGLGEVIRHQSIDQRMMMSMMSGDH